jgi:hypothetical protein
MELPYYQKIAHIAGKLYRFKRLVLVKNVISVLPVPAELDRDGDLSLKNYG